MRSRLLGSRQHHRFEPAHGTRRRRATRKDSPLTALAERWRRSLEQFLGLVLCCNGEQHVRNALIFLGGGQAVAALGHGRRPLELVGADPAAPRARFDALGAAYFEGEIAKIDEGPIVFRRSTGSILTLRRRRGDLVQEFPREGGGGDGR